MELAWDDAKEAANLAKHKLSLSLAGEIDLRATAIVEDRRHAYGERRFIVYAMLRSRVHVVIMSPRDDRLRVISLRKANHREVRRYHDLRSVVGRSG